MCDIFDDGISAEEMALLLAITEEIEEEEQTKQIGNEQLTHEQMLEISNELDEE